MGRACASSDPACPVDRAISVLQEKWVLSIVHTLLDGPRGFNELGREVGGCNPTTLTQRLARLEEIGLVTRICEQERGARSGYALTQSGEALSDVIEAIHAWSLLHLHAAERTVPAPSPLHAGAAPAALGTGSLVVDGAAERTSSRRTSDRRTSERRTGDDRTSDRRTGDGRADLGDDVVVEPISASGGLT